MTLSAGVVLAVLLASPAWTQDPADPPSGRRTRVRRVTSDVRVILEESPEGDYDHDYYEQALPVEFRSGSSSLRSGVWFKTVCRPQEEDRKPIYLPPASSSATFSLPLSISAGVGAPRFRVSASASTISAFTGRPRSDPGTTPPTTPPPTTPPPTTGPTSTKPALFGGADPDSDTSSDAPFLFGPDLDLVVASDLSRWPATRWLGEGASLHLYARALFGSVEVFDTPTSLQLYGVGPRLSVPLARSSTFDLSLTFSAGPAFLRTGIGDAVGFDGGIGLRLQQDFTPSFSFVAGVEANLFSSQNVTAFGPVVNLGFNLSW